MEISIEHLSQLARLSLSDKEMKLFGDQLENILLYVEKLNEPDTRGVEATSHVVLLLNVEREDSLKPCLDREEAMMNAPDRNDRFYRVPKIIE